MLNYDFPLSPKARTYLKFEKVFSAAADLEMEKFKSSAAFITLSLVVCDTRSGRVKERETVEMETCARRATSWILLLIKSPCTVITENSVMVPHAGGKVQMYAPSCN